MALARFWPEVGAGEPEVVAQAVREQAPRLDRDVPAPTVDGQLDRPDVCVHHALLSARGARRPQRSLHHDRRPAGGGARPTRADPRAAPVTAARAASPAAANASSPGSAPNSDISAAVIPEACRRCRRARSAHPRRGRRRSARAPPPRPPIPQPAAARARPRSRRCRRRPAAPGSGLRTAARPARSAVSYGAAEEVRGGDRALARGRAHGQLRVERDRDDRQVVGRVGERQVAADRPAVAHRGMADTGGGVGEHRQARRGPPRRARAGRRARSAPAITSPLASSVASSAIRLTSTSAAGRSAWAFISGTRLWPPASTRAPSSASSATASSTVVGAA